MNISPRNKRLEFIFQKSPQEIADEITGTLLRYTPPASKRPESARALANRLGLPLPSSRAQQDAIDRETGRRMSSE